MSQREGKGRKKEKSSQTSRYQYSYFINTGTELCELPRHCVVSYQSRIRIMYNVQLYMIRKTIALSHSIIDFVHGR